MSDQSRTDLKSVKKNRIRPLLQCVYSKNLLAHSKSCRGSTVLHGNGLITGYEFERGLPYPDILTRGL